MKLLRPWLVILLVAVLLAGCAAPAPAATPAPQIALAPCRLSAPLVANSVAAECGTLTVPENPADPAGRTIDLRIAVVPAISRGAAADPLFLLAGGPGQAATEAFVTVIPSLRAVNQTRDLVMVDQRGTGGSAPLACPIDPALADVSADDPAYGAWLARCRDGLAGDPAFYTTAVAVGDLDAVRAALGYAQINLLGVSYGTRAALTYLRLFPERVRSLVLDGVVPPDLPIGAAMAQDAQAALDLTFSRCGADPRCSAAFPNLSASFQALLDRLAAAPAEVALDDPFTGAPTSVTLTRELAAISVQTLSYAPETAALLPLLIHTAQVDGDLRPLAAQSLLIGQQLADSIAVGMRLSVVCAEDVPFFPADAAAQSAGSYLGDDLIAQFQASCAAWPHAAPAAEGRAPLESDVPALLLSGEADPVTPPAYGEAVARALPNSRHIVAPGQGHNVFYRGCLPGLVASFIEAGSAADLDAACVDLLKPTPFFTSFAGPVP